jgi:hypothetical protein
VVQECTVRVSIGLRSKIYQRFRKYQRLREQHQRALEEEAVQRAQEQRARDAAAYEFQQRQQNALRSITISNVTVTWVHPSVVYLGDCVFPGVRFDLAVTNGSREVITAVSFGWIFLQEPGAKCPVLSTKTTMNLNLRAGETTGLILYDDGARSVPPYYCLSITGVAMAP